MGESGGEWEKRGPATFHVSSPGKISFRDFPSQFPLESYSPESPAAPAGETAAPRESPGNPGEVGGLHQRQGRVGAYLPRYPTPLG